MPAHLQRVDRHADGPSSEERSLGEAPIAGDSVVKAAKRGLSAEQSPVLVARDRHRSTIGAVLPKRNRASVAAALGGVVTPDNQLCYDGGRAIVGFARKGGMPCQVLPSPGGPRPEAPNLHIDNINGYHSRLKEWLRPSNPHRSFRTPPLPEIGSRTETPVSR